MEEIKQETTVQEPEVSAAQIYVDNLQAIKQTTVEKSAYDKLIEENKVLAKALTERTFSAENEDEAEPELTPLEDIRKELYSSERNLSNYDYLSRSLELHNRTLEETGEDDYCVKDSKGQYSQDDLAASAQTAEFYKAALEYASQAPDKDQALKAYFDTYLTETPQIKIKK